MASATDIASSVLDFSDAEFFAPDTTDVTPREMQLLDSSFIGVAVNAPNRIQLPRRSSIPVAIAARHDGVRDWDVPLRRNFFLIATNLDDGSVHLAPGLVSEKELESRGGRTELPAESRPPHEELEGVGAQISWTEAARRLTIPRQAGRWALGAIYFDWVSNIVPIELLDGSPSHARVHRTVSPPPGNTLDLPTYRKMPDTPAVPGNGAAYSVRIESSTGGQRQMLRVTGSFRVPIRSYSKVPTFAIVDRGQAIDVVALVPVTFVVVGVNRPRPWQFEWAVPVYEGAIGIDQVAEGYFALDAFDTDDLPLLSPGLYASYLVMDGLIYGPNMISVA